MSDPRLTVYGANWCPDCRQSKKFLGEQRIPYEWVDITDNDEAIAFVESANHLGKVSSMTPELKYTVLGSRKLAHTRSRLPSPLISPRPTPMVLYVESDAHAVESAIVPFTFR